MVMTPLQKRIFKEVNKVEEMSENAFLTAWDDYFKKFDAKVSGKEVYVQLITKESIRNFKKWVTE